MNFGKRDYDADRVVVLAGCGKDKIDDGHEHFAKDLYTSSYFGLKRSVSEPAGRWYILSAEHGLVHPSMPLAYYDTSMKDLDADETTAWGDSVAAALLSRWGEFSRANVECLVCLAGADYADPLMEAFRRHDDFETRGEPDSVVTTSPDYENDGLRVEARGHELRFETPLRGMGFHAQMSWLSYRAERNHDLSEYVGDEVTSGQ